MITFKDNTERLFWKQVFMRHMEQSPTGGPVHHAKVADAAIEQMRLRQSASEPVAEPSLVGGGDVA